MVPASSCPHGDPAPSSLTRSTCAAVASSSPQRCILCEAAASDDGLTSNAAVIAPVRSALPHRGVRLIPGHVGLRGASQALRDLPQDGVEVLGALVPPRLLRLVFGRRLTSPARNKRGQIALQVAQLLLDVGAGRAR